MSGPPVNSRLQFKQIYLLLGQIFRPADRAGPCAAPRVKGNNTAYVTAVAPQASARFPRLVVCVLLEPQ